MLALAASTYGVQAQTFSEPVDYVKFFNQEFFTIQQLQIEYMSVLVHEDDQQAVSAQQKLQKQVGTSLQKFNALQPYAKDNGLRQNAIQTLTAIQELASQDYNKIVQEKAGCNTCFEGVLLESQLTAKDGKELEKNMQKMNKSILKFAKDNNIQIESGDNEYDIVIKKMNKVSDYLRDLNLVVLQMQDADAKVIEAFNKNDLKAAHEAHKKMSKAVEESKKRLDKLDRIPEDYMCIKKVEALYNHYLQADQKYYPEMLSAFDKNGAIINSKVDLFNRNIQRVNEGAARNLSGYYESRTELLKKNTPQPKQSVIRV